MDSVQREGLGLSEGPSREDDKRQAWSDKLGYGLEVGPDAMGRLSEEFPTGDTWVGQLWQMVSSSRDVIAISGARDSRWCFSEKVESENKNAKPSCPAMPEPICFFLTSYFLHRFHSLTLLCIPHRSYL